MHSLDSIDKWEYRSEVFELRGPYDGPPGSAIIRMNELGAEGWELVSTSVRAQEYSGTMLCMFKRRRVE